MIITHEKAAAYLRIGPATLHKLCRAGVGPKRKQIKVSGCLAWSYDHKSLDKYIPMSFCCMCHKPFPSNNTKRGAGCFCSPECKSAWSAHLQGKKKKGVKFVTGPKKNCPVWDVTCPVCHVSHTIKSKAKPESKWVYCKAHENRRYWEESPCDGRVAGCQI